MRISLRDVRYAVRTLTRAPLFSTTSTLLLALGIGAVTTIFSLVDHVLIRPLPYPEPDRLIVIEDGSHSGPFFRRIESVAPVERWAAAFGERSNWIGEGEPTVLSVSRVSKNYFSVLGGRAGLGRLLEPDDFLASDVVLLSYRVWAARFGSDPRVLGRTLRLDGQPVTIVGVVERSFEAPEPFGGDRAADLFRPIDWSRTELQEHNYWVLDLIGRVADGASIEDARAAIAQTVASFAVEAPDQYMEDGAPRALPVTPLHEVSTRSVRFGLGLLFGAVVLLLLIACSNVAHLFLARGLARRPELALRRALGASRASLVGQLLIEGVIVAGVAGVIGLGLATFAVRAFRYLSPEALPRGEASILDVRVLAFAFALSLLTTLLFGLAPALRAAKQRPASAMTGQRGSTVGAGLGGLRGGVIAAELAVTVVLIAAAGTLVRSFLEVHRQETGLVAENVWVVPLSPTGLEDGEGYRRTMEPIRESLAAVPGVASATYALSTPFTFVGGGRCCWRRGFRDPQAADPESTTPLFIHPVARDYFSTFGIPIRRGSVWRPEEGVNRPLPAVLPTSTAAELFGSSDDALGRELRMGEDTTVVVVGLIGDVRHFGLDQQILPEIYLPIDILPFGDPLGSMAVRFESEAPAGTARVLKEAIWAVAPRMPVPEVTTLERQIADSTALRRFESVLFSSFGLVALVLASGGLYGVLLYSVGRRRREMGIRLALGARRGQLEGHVVRGGLAIAAWGIGVGLALSWVALRLLESRIWGVAARDPAALFGAVVVLLAIALVASWLPARRASRVDPVETLRAG